jgi:hypothetical protein
MTVDIRKAIKTDLIEMERLCKEYNDSDDSYKWGLIGKILYQETIVLLQ